MELNYTLTTIEERQELVNKILSEKNNEDFTPRQLEMMANYLLFTMTKEEKKAKTIITNNRSATMRKREMSYEGLIDKLEQGESGIQPLIANDKNIIFSHAISITPEELEQIPYMRQLRESIEKLENETFYGRKAFAAKKAAIELRQDQYILKQSYKPPTRLQQKTKSVAQIDWYTDISVDKNGNLQAKGLCTLLNPKHVKAMLTNYKFLRPEVPRSSDLYYLLDELDEIIAELPEIFADLAYLKIKEYTNQEIQDAISQKHGIAHSLEYLSSLWQNKIPKMIAAIAEERWLNWYYTNKEEGKWKTCTRCGETKLAHNIYFSKNKTDPSGFYSICKACRNAKTKERKN